MTAAGYRALALVVCIVGVVATLYGPTYTTPRVYQLSGVPSPELVTSLSATPFPAHRPPPIGSLPAWMGFTITPWIVAPPPTTIDRGMEEVWDTLTSAESMAEYWRWNPFTPKLASTWGIGDEVHICVSFANNSRPVSPSPQDLRCEMEVVEYVTAFLPPQRCVESDDGRVAAGCTADGSAAWAALAYGQGIGPAWFKLFQAERVQMVEALGPGQSRYLTFDRFEGVLAWIVQVMYGRVLDSSFTFVGPNLKEYVEGRA